MSGGIETVRANQRAERRAEIYQKRIADYRTSLAEGSQIRSWGDAVAAQEKAHARRVKYTRYFARLDGQLQGHLQTLPDQSGIMRVLEANVVTLTSIDDIVGLGGLAGEYAESLGEYRRVKGQERERVKFKNKAENLSEQVNQLNPYKTIHLNPESRQAIVGDQLVTFEDPKDWEVFYHLARFRNSKIKPGDIRQIVAEHGDKRPNSSYHAIKRQREIIGDSISDPKIITTNSHGRGANYSFAPTEARFHYPSQEMRPEEEIVVSEKENVVNFDSYRSTTESGRMEELLRRVPALQRKINRTVKQVLRAPAISTDKLASLDQVGRAFSGVRIEYIQSLHQRGYISPQLRDDGHPGFTIEEIAFMVLMKRHCEGLNLTPPLVKQLKQVVRSRVEEEIQTRSNTIQEPTRATQR